MRILVTAGPTREPLDAVRFLSNGATGRLGIVLAEEAVAAGHDVVLVLGPTHLAPPRHPRIEVRPVVTARDMLAAASDAWDPADGRAPCDALVATAAVADHRPAEAAAGKPEKGTGEVLLRLVPNPDVLATLAATKGARPCIGFALQVEDGVARARAKLVRKNLDAVVLDGPSALGAEHADFRVLTPDGAIEDLPAHSKREVSRRILELLGTLALRSRPHPGPDAGAMSAP